MDLLDRVLLARAETQVAELDPRAPSGRDSWALRESGPARVDVTSKARFPCLGCGKEPVRVRFTYGRRCRKRLEAGLPVDLETFVTERESRALAKRMPSPIAFGGARDRR